MLIGHCYFCIEHLLNSAKDSFNFDADPDLGSALKKLDLDQVYFQKKILNFLTKQIFKFCFIFFAYFYTSSDLGFESKSVDPHIFADPDPGSQNLADPTDPNPKHCFYDIISPIKVCN